MLFQLSLYTGGATYQQKFGAKQLAFLCFQGHCGVSYDKLDYNMTLAWYDAQYLQNNGQSALNLTMTQQIPVDYSQIASDYFWFYVCYSHKVSKGQLFVVLNDGTVFHHEWRDLMMIPYHLKFSLYPIYPYTASNFGICNLSQHLLALRSASYFFPSLSTFQNVN